MRAAAVLTVPIDWIGATVAIGLQVAFDFRCLLNIGCGT